jgi:hypothetical protein
LGLGASTANVLVPTQIGTDTNWQVISVGTSALFAGAIKSDGTFWDWGYNNYSQLGDGLTVQLQVPTFISCPASTSATVTACDSYTWADTGTMYTTSGIYTNPVTNNDLRLTINNSSMSTTSETACESYTWGANGTTYTQSGTYTNVVTGTSGCTHTATLLLTVDHNTSASVTETACESYTWDANGTTYTQSGTYTNVVTGTSGCTATATLNLTINNAVAPTADSPQVISEDIAANATIADIVISPSTVVWYGSESDALAQVNALDASTVLINGATYFAVNTLQGCVSDPFPVLISVTLGNAVFDLAALRLYPNPASDSITIQYPQGIDSVAVTNMIGQQVIEKSFTAEEATIDVSNLPSGTYFVKAYSGGLSKTLKFIKE